MVRKGRKGYSPRGETHHNAKLSDAEVDEIRSSNERTRVLMEKYCVAQTTIDGIRSGRWRRVTELKDAGAIAGVSRGPHECEEILKRWRDGR